MGVLEVCMTAGIPVFKCICVYFISQKSLGLRVYRGPLWLCGIFKANEFTLPVLWVGWPGVCFKPKPEQVLHSQYPTADLPVQAALHLCSMFSTRRKLGELIFAWNVLERCSLRGHWKNDVCSCDPEVTTYFLVSLLSSWKHGVEGRSLNSNKNWVLVHGDPFSWYLPSIPYSFAPFLLLYN